MNDLRIMYEQINTLEDLTLYKTSLTGGESHELEGKSVNFELAAAKPSDVGDFTLLVSKEISAFANTDGGLIALGIDNSFKVQNQTTNLLNWVDKHERDFIEPVLSGIKKKVCLDKDGNQFVLLYIPKGESVPYRVHSVKSSTDKRIAREYFQRVGSNSVPVPESIVRYMYLSRGRTIDIDIDPVIVQAGNLDAEKRPIIRMGLKVQPDYTRLIDRYYLSSSVTLLSREFNPIMSEPLIISEGSLKHSVIPPTNTAFMLSTFDIRSEISIAPVGPYSMVSTSIDNIDFDNTQTIDIEKFQNIFALHARTEYACDGMPMKVSNKLIVLGDKKEINEETWHEVSGWMNNNCMVDRYISFGQDQIGEMHAMENYIRNKGLE